MYNMYENDNIIRLSFWILRKMSGGKGFWTGETVDFEGRRIETKDARMMIKKNARRQKLDIARAKFGRNGFKAIESKKEQKKRKENQRRNNIIFLL